MKYEAPQLVILPVESTRILVGSDVGIDVGGDGEEDS